MLYVRLFKFVSVKLPYYATKAGRETEIKKRMPTTHVC